MPGSARLYREPVSKTNRPIIMNAVEYVVLPGEVNKETRRRVLEEIEKCDCPHFLILFRDSKLQFRALYAFYPDTEEVRLYILDPNSVPFPPVQCSGQILLRHLCGISVLLESVVY